MWKLLGFSDDKDPDVAAAPQQLTMVRSKAISRQNDEASEEEEASRPSSAAMSKTAKGKTGGPGGKFLSCEFTAHGIRMDYPKQWSVVEEQRKIVLYHPSDRSISINLIIGVVAFGTDLEELTAQALDMPRKLMTKGVLDHSSLPLHVKDCTMLGKPACTLSYLLNMGGKRQVEQTWTEHRGRSFIVTRAAPENVFHTHKVTFDRIVESLAFLSKEAEEYEPPEEERKRAARFRRGPATPTSHEGMYLSKPGVLIFSTAEDYARHFRVRYPGIFEILHAEDAADGEPCIKFKLNLHPHGIKDSDDGKEQESKQIKLRESLEALQIHVIVSSQGYDSDRLERARQLAIGAEVVSSEAKLGDVDGRKLEYKVTQEGSTQKITEVMAAKDGRLYILHMSHPHDETEEAKAEAEAHSYFYTHMIKQFEFISASTPSKAEIALYQNFTTHPKISIEYPMKTHQIQPSMGGPFVISLVHFTDQEEEEGEGEKRQQKGKSKGKGKEKAQPDDSSPHTPTSMVGLIVSPLPQQGGEKAVWNLDKFCKMIKEQLYQKGSNCRILSEEEVTITNGRMKGRDITYIADAQPVGGVVQSIKNALAMKQMQCVQRVYLFGNTSYVLLFQTLDSHFEEEWALAAPIFNSFQFFS